MLFSRQIQAGKNLLLLEEHLRYRQKMEVFMEQSEKSSEEGKFGRGSVFVLIFRLCGEDGGVAFVSESMVHRLTVRSN